jgi:uncharacterized protein YndB with AHSA1/START domain
MTVATICVPDLSSRPLKYEVQLLLPTSAAKLYRAWTQEFDRWFAAPGRMLMRAEINAPYFFEVEHEGKRHVHYGRFLRLQPDALIEFTWVTGTGGTKGVETMLTIELAERSGGTQMSLTHVGFGDAESRDAYAQGWPHVLAQFEKYVTAT